MLITEKIVDLTNGEESIIEREETADEKKYRLAKEKEFALQLAEAEAKEIARQEILDRLGLTADEAKLLLG